MEKTTIYLPADLRWYLKDAARRSGKSQADVIRDALEAQRAGASRPRVTIVGIADAPGALPAAAVAERRRRHRDHVERKLADRRLADA